MSGPPIRVRGRIPRGEHGSGAVLLLAVVLVALTAALVIGALVRVQAARSSAQAAADLAALAAAAEVAIPPVVVLAPGVSPDPGQACARAATVAQRNGVRLTACTVGSGRTVRVEVAGATPWGPATAAAVAGPASARVSPARP